MFNRRTLLRALLCLGGLPVLISACNHRSPYAEEKQTGTEYDSNRGY